MKSVRSGVFETNSSSTHSLTICTGDDFKKWEAGELLYNTYTEKFLMPSELIEAGGRFFDKNDEEYVNYSDWLDGIEYETYKQAYTTKSGDNIIAFGYYGHD